MQVELRVVRHEQLLVQLLAGEHVLKERGREMRGVNSCSVPGDAAGTPGPEPSTNPARLLRNAPGEAGHSP